MSVEVSIERRLDLLRLASVARQLGTTRQTIYTWIARGFLASTVIDGQSFVDAAELERFKGSEELARFRARQPQGARTA